MSTLTNSFAYKASDEEAGNRWTRWWFEPVSPLNLGFCRLLFFALLLIDELATTYGDWTTLPASFVQKIWLFKKLHLPILSSVPATALEIIWKLSLFLACIGLFTRVATILSFFLGIYLIGLQYNYGKIDHMTAMLVFTTAILALSHCGDAVSIDRLIQKRRDPSPLPPSGEYRWPVRMIWVLMSIIFFAAGMAKVINGGLTWVLSENFALLLIQRHYMDNVPTLSWGLFFAKYPLLYQGFAAGTIFIESCMFLALFNSRVRVFLPYMLLSMQIGIGLFMRVWFTPYMFVYLFWVPWDKIFLLIVGKNRAAVSRS